MYKKIVLCFTLILFLCSLSSHALAYTVGAEWINDWPGTVNDRSHWDESAEGFYNKINGTSGWSGEFLWSNYNSWEKDFKRMDLGGLNNNYADAVDICLIGTHGSNSWDSYYGKTLSSVYFSSDHADFHLTPSDARRCLGDYNLEWVCFDSCSVLKDSSRGYWHKTFNGLHLMLGFKNTMYVISYGDGKKWAKYMVDDGWWDWPRTVTQAWFTATWWLQPGSVTARVLAEVNNNYNDYLWGEGYVSPDPTYNSTYWYWDSDCGSEVPLSLETLPDQVLLYEVSEVAINEAYVQNLASVFDFSDDIQIHDDGEMFCLNDNGKVLSVAKNSGIYFYQDLNKLWVPSEEAINLPSAKLVQGIVEDKYGQLIPENAVFNKVYTENLYEVEKIGEMQDVVIDPATGLTIPSGDEPNTLPEEGEVFSSANLLSLDNLSSFDSSESSSLSRSTTVSSLATLNTTPPADTMYEVLKRTVPIQHVVDYVRHLPAYVSDDGEHGDLVSVVGSGPKIKAVVGEGGQINGLMGGWREVSPGQMEATYPSEEAWELYKQYGDRVAIANPEMGAADMELTSTTFGYYEKSGVEEQTALIPCYIFSVNYLSAGEVTDSSYVYLPAVQSYLPVIAEITGPEDGSTILEGEEVILEGDAIGGQPDYTYSWSSDIDGYLGNTNQLAVSTLSVARREGVIVAHAISLEVKDDSGVVSQDKIHVTVNPEPVECPDCDIASGLIVESVTSEGPGSTVIIPVSILDAPNIVAAGGFELSYDPYALKYVNFTKGNLIQNFQVFWVNKISDGLLRIGAFEDYDEESAVDNRIQAGDNGTFVNLEFKVLQCDQFSNSILSLGNLVDDFEGWDTCPGCASCCPHDGDVNEDGSITPEDALWAFEYYMGLRDLTPCQQTRANVMWEDGSGVTPADASCIFLTYMGYPSCLVP